MNRITHWLVAAATCLLAVCASAATTEVAGVKFENPIELAGSKLQLNGAGVRYKAVFQVYAAGLYLTHKASTADEVLAAVGPKRVSITMLRTIDAAELGKLFTRGVEDNAPRNEMSKLVPGLVRMGQIFSEQKPLNKGDSFLIDWIPGTGTVITVRGKPQGEPFKEPEFFNALLKIWLGPNPADWKLKEAMLGR